MDFPKVEQRPVFLTQLGRPGSKIDGYKAIINPDNGNVFSVVSEDYVLTPHEQMIETIHQVMAKMPEYGKPTETIKLYDGGAKMRATYVFEEVEVNVGKHDLLHPQIDMLNSYDLGWARKIFFGAYRLVCKNGLTIGEKIFAYKTRHDTSFNAENVSATLISSMEHLSEQKRIWEKWVDRITMPNEYERVINALPLANKDVAAIGEEVEVSSGITMDAMKLRTLSVWLFFNILCQYVTHRVESHLKKAAIESAMRRAFYF